MNVLEGCVSGLSRRTYNQVVCALEHTSPLSKHWAGLAEVLGFPTVEIQAIKQVHGDSFTVRMLDTWERSGKSSVKKLIIALACLGRVDCVWILQEDSALQGTCAAVPRVARNGNCLFSPYLCFRRAAHALCVYCIWTLFCCLFVHHVFASEIRTERIRIIKEGGRKRKIRPDHTDCVVLS